MFLHLFQINKIYSKESMYQDSVISKLYLKHKVETQQHVIKHYIFIVNLRLLSNTRHKGLRFMDVDKNDIFIL